MRATWLAVACVVMSALDAACGSGASGVDQAGSEAGTAALSTHRTRRPAAPAGLTATVSGGNVLLAWAPAANATGYSVYRATSSAGTYKALTASPQPATIYTDGSVTPGTTYWYEVRASNAAGSSSASAPVSATAPAAGQAVTVTVSPGAATVDACKTLQLSAAVTGTASTGVTWYVQEGAAGGTVTSTGLYTAPPTAGTYHAIATSSVSSSATATATVTVKDHILSVALNPSAVTLEPGGTTQFTSTVTTTCGTFAAQ
jgi:fibronectin type 3 domain-containing protein